MQGPSESIATTVENRKLRSTSFSLSPEDRTFLPHFLHKQDLISIKTPFNSELIAESIEQKHYLNSTQREDYRITIKDGFFYDAKGELLAGPHMFVLFPDYRLYASKLSLGLNHSHLSSGLALKGAGMLYMQYGRLMTMSNDSGHYKPTFIEMHDAMDWFFAQSNHDNYLFEDHSRQDSDLEFNGIQYFQLSQVLGSSDSRVNAIENSQLVNILFGIKQKALVLFQQLQDFLCSKLESLSLDDPLENLIFNDPSDRKTECYITTIKDAKVKIPEEKSILDCPDLLQYTCLYRIKAQEKLISRYNGLPALTAKI